MNNQGSTVFKFAGSHEAVTGSNGSGLSEDLKAVLPVVFGKIFTHNRSEIVETVDVGSEVGSTACVYTGPDGCGDNNIVYAKRVGKPGHSRFVKKCDIEKTSKVTVILRKNSRGCYHIIAAYFGPKAPPEVWDRRLSQQGSNAAQEARDFWSNHALIWDTPGLETCPETEVVECPWDVQPVAV